jgi:hypothetical protein
LPAASHEREHGKPMPRSDPDAVKREDRPARWKGGGRGDRFGEMVSEGHGDDDARRHSEQCADQEVTESDVRRAGHHVDQSERRYWQDADDHDGDYAPFGDALA